MAIITTDKVILIVVVTAIVVVLAYVFRFGRFSRRRQTETDSDKGIGRPSQVSFKVTL